jgi:hypothetical protein
VTAPAACRSCGAEVVWERTKNDKLTPVNPDGTPHWATCPAAKDWRRKK